MSQLFAGRQWVLETILSQEQCVSRLKSKLRGMWETGWNADKPLYGTVTRSKFAVQITASMGRGMNPYFVRGVFTPSPAGTTIRAKYGVLTTYRLFMTGMASFFLFMLGRVFWSTGLTLFFVSTLLPIVLITYWRARRLIRTVDFDRDLILGAVAEILEARISETPEAVS